MSMKDDAFKDQLLKQYQNWFDKFIDPKQSGEWFGDIVKTMTKEDLKTAHKALISIAATSKMAQLPEFWFIEATYETLGEHIESLK